MIWYLLKVVVVYIVACVPAPSDFSSLARIKNCSREQSSIVRQFVHSVWQPVFKRFNVQLSSQCPLHFARDIFAVTELAKLHFRQNLWTCSICGKSFYREPYLDLHLAKHHSDVITLADHSTCFADFCDVFRCQGLLDRKRRKRRSKVGSVHSRPNALLELGINVFEDIDAGEEGDSHDGWNPFGGQESPENADSSENALVAAPPMHVLRALEEKNRLDKSGQYVVGMDSDMVEDPFGVGGSPDVQTLVSAESWLSSRPRRDAKRSKAESNRDDSNENQNSNPKKFQRPDYFDKILRKVDHFIQSKSPEKVSSNSALEEEIKPDPNNEENYGPSYWKYSSDCDEEEMSKRHLKCQKLIFDCVGPLILNLSDEEFSKIAETLDRDLCWYLTCDRRHLFKGDDLTDGGGLAGVLPSNASHFILLAILMAALATILAFLYYLVWFCF